MIKRTLAQQPYTLGNLEGIGPLYSQIEGTTGLPLLERVISITIGVMTIIAGIYFLFLFISAAYQWISAGGDKNKLQAAQQKMVHGIFGLLIVIAAYAVIALMGAILGFCILQPASLLENIWS
jgi:predicted metal-binding membrane protein